MKNEEEICMTYSSVLSKEGKPYVSVRFERGRDMAEGSVPICHIEKSSGFTKEEIMGLEGYLELNAREILRKAKDISGIRYWLGMEK